MDEPVRVLLVSDDTDLTGGVTAAFEEAHHEFTVTVEASASAGLDRLRTDTVDCVVSEYDLSEQDGVAFLRAVRDRYGGLPFVLYATEGDEAVAADAIAADVTEYLRRGDASDQHTTLADTVVDAVADAPASIGRDSRPTQTEQILKTVPGCVVQLDTEGRFTYANRRAEEVLGLEQSAVVGRAYNDPEWEIRDPHGKPIPDEELPFRQVRDSGEPLYDYHHSIRWPDGSEKILSVSGVPLIDDHGTVERVVFSLTDITEQTLRERNLERYRQIVAHLDDIATIIDPDGTIEYVSPAVERVLGYEPQELTGTNGFGYQPPETTDAVAEAIERVLDDPAEPITVQTKFRRADGSWCWIESSLRNSLDNEAIDGILVSSRDVTDRLDRKRQLERREQQLDRLHRATREFLSSETPEAVAETASRTAVDVLDFPLNGIHFYDESAGGLAPIAVSDASQALLDEVPVIDEGIAWQTFESGEEQIYDDIAAASEVYNTDSPIQSEMHLPLVGHGVFIISSTESDAFEEADVELARVLAANTEAALERIAKEQQLRSRESELEQQNERLEEFASIVSHDLRNPLNVAQASAALLTEESDGEHVRSVNDALDRMEELISDTLTLARQGSVVAETEPVHLTDLVTTCWNNVSTGEATIEIVDESTIYADQSRLRHVFENLFRNSVEHGSTGSRTQSDDSVEHGSTGSRSESDDAVEHGTTSSRSEAPEDALAPDGEEVTVRIGRLDDCGIYVEDSGPGIPEADRETVFEPGHTSATGGTGFGLTIVRRIVEAHGWTVDITTGTDGGARFEFSGVEMADT